METRTDETRIAGLMVGGRNRGSNPLGYELSKIPKREMEEDRCIVTRLPALVKGKPESQKAGKRVSSIKADGISEKEL